MRDLPADWREEAARKLANSKLSADEREEISRELAGYLEDRCAESRAAAADESSATARAAQELNEDPRLGAHLHRARQEGNMNDRVKRFWVPGLTMFFVSAAVLLILKSTVFPEYFAHAGDVSVHADSHRWILPVKNMLAYREASFLVYLFWLFLLPFLAATGAWWSRRAGSGQVLQIVTGLFPLILLGTIFMGVLAREATFPFDFTVRIMPPNVFPMIGELGDLLLSWVVIPGAALLLGVLPFLFSSPKCAQGIDSPISA